MISERFRALLAEAADDAPVTGVLRWDFSPPPPGRDAQLAGLLGETKAALLRRLAMQGGLKINDLAALPYAVLTGPAAAWRQVLRESPAELAAPSVTLDANVEVPLAEPFRPLP
jgi:hypothetical protein